MQKKRVFLLLIFITAFLLLIGLGGEVKAYTLEATESNFSKWLTNGYNDEVGDTLSGKTSNGIKWKATILEVDSWIEGKYGFGKVRIEIEEIPENITEFEIPTSIALNKTWGLFSFDYNYDVTTISVKSFRKCSNVEKIVIPKSITTIEGGAFFGCEKLKYLEVANDNANFKDNGEGIVLSKDGTKLVYYPNNKRETEYTIPSGIKIIGKYAFSSNNNLENIIISSDVQEIEEYAFYATNISKMEIPNTVTKLGLGLFNSCKALKQIILPTNLTELPANIFRECEKLEEITLPNSIVDIGQSAFEECTNLKKIEIPKNVTKIGICAFNKCTNLEEIKFAGDSKLETILLKAFSECESLKTIEIPEGTKTIYKNIFNGCKELRSIVIPSSLTKIGFTDKEQEVADDVLSDLIQEKIEEYTIQKGDLTEEEIKQFTEYAQSIFDDTGIKECSKDLVVYTPNNKTVIDMIKSDFAPAYMIYEKKTDNVELIGYYDIKCTCTNLYLLNSIYGLPVEKIGNDILKNNKRIEKVVLPENLKEIGARGFYYATSLKEIFIPKSLEKIGDKAFYGCENLNRVVIRKGSKMTSIAEGAFNACADDLKIYYNSQENENNSVFAEFIKATDANKTIWVADDIGPTYSVNKSITPAQAYITIKVKDTISGVYRYKINKTKDEKTKEGEWIIIDDSFEKDGDYYVIKQTITENCTVEVIIEDAVGNENKASSRTIEITSIDEVNPQINKDNIEIIGSKEKATIKVQVSDEGGSRLAKYALTEFSNINSVKEEEWKLLSGNEYTINEEVLNNGTYYLFVLDGKGNIAKETIEVDKIDNVAPDIISISTTTENNICTLEVSVEDKGDEGYSPIGLKDYAIYTEKEKDQEKEWKNFEGNPIETEIKEIIEFNGSWYIEIRDVYGNTVVSGQGNIDIEGLEDTQTPTISFDSATNKEVTVNIKDGFSGIKSADLEYAWSSNGEQAPTSGYVKVNTAVEENTKKISFKADASNLTGEYYLWIKINNLEDNAGNKYIEANIKSEKYIFDNTKPTIKTTTTGTIVGKNGDTKTYELTFSEDVKIDTSKKLIVSNENCTATIKQKNLDNNKEWIIEIKIGEGNGTASITIPKDMFKDNSGNTMEKDVVLENIIIIDNTKPTISEEKVTIDQVKPINSTKTIKYEIELDKNINVDNTKLEEIKIENNAQAKISDGVKPSITIDGKKCTIEVTVEPNDGIKGEAILVLPEGLFSDEAGNKTEEIKLKGLKIDTKKPNVLVSTDYNGEYVNKEQTVTFTITTDEVVALNKEDLKIKVTGEGITVDDKDITVNSELAEPFTIWKINVTNINGEGEAKVIVPESYFEDNAGNKSVEKILGTVKVDDTAPTVQISSPVLSESKDSAKFTISATDTLSGVNTYAISTNENANEYDKWEAISTEGIEKEVKANGIYYVFVKDKSGNIGKAQVAVEGIIDKIAPVATITGPDKELANSETVVKYLVTLSEQVEKDENINPKFSEEGISAEIKVEQKANEVYEIIVSKISGNGQATLVLPKGIFKDTSGNESAETTKEGLIIDNKAPILEKTISTKENKILVTIKADEKVQNIDGWTLSEDATTLAKEFDADYTGNIEVKDLSGNKTTEEIKVVFVSEVTITGKQEAKTEETVELVGKVNPENASIKDLTWKSSDENIATVSQNGKVTCKSNGKVTITATAHNGVKGEIQLEIVKNNVVEKIEVTTQPNKKKYVEGDTFNSEGMEVNLVYTEGNKEKTTDYAWTPVNMQAETKEITIVYTKDENIKTTITGIEVYKKEDVKEITISKEEYEKIKDLINDDIIDTIVGNDIVKIVIAPNEKLTLTVDNSPKEIYNVGDIFDASIYKLTIKKENTTKEITLTKEMISFDENLIDKNTYKFKEEAQGKNVEITVNYLGCTAKFSVKVKSSEQGNISFGDLELIKEDNTNYLRTDSGLTIEETIKKIEDANSKISLEIKVFDKNGKEIKDLTNSKTMTGMKIKIKNEEEELEYVLVVTGDLNSDGKVNVLDIMKLLQHVAETQATNEKDDTRILKDAYLLAADINKDGKTGTLDIVQLLRLVSDLMS